MSNFVHLHTHSHFSLMDGLNTPKELLEAARDVGQTALAITDHGTLSSHRAMQKDAKEVGLKPILGLEAYISPTDRFDKRDVKKREDNTQLYNHIIILAQDQGGLRNLQKLSEIAWSEGYYYKPRIDRDSLEEYRDGLIVLSGCMNGLISKAILRGDFDEAHNLTEWFKKIFEEKFYMEIQPHNPRPLNIALLELADKYSIKPVVTADSHFAKEEDRAIEEAMLILSTSPKPNKEANFSQSRKIQNIFDRYNYLYPERPISFEKLDVFISSRDEIARQLEAQGIDREDVFESSVEIADSISEYDFHESLDLLPKPKGEDPDAILERKAWAGLKERGFKGNDVYENRLREELEIIKNKNFSSYFLIVGNTINWARSKGIMVGPGRGSAAGSLLCYALKITEINPIEYNLLFFRFINPERNDFPDIDIDFEDRRRGEVKEYLRRQFKNVASIITFNTFKDKGVIRDAGRIFMVPLADVNRALKGVDPVTGKDYIDDVFLKAPQGREFANKYPEVMDLVNGLRGKIRSTGMHPAGIVIAKEPIANYAPIQTVNDPNDKNGPRIPLVAYDMGETEEVGLLKLDALGLKTLSVISDTLVEINKRHGVTINLNEINLDDAGTLKMIDSGNTKGLFQAEGHAFHKWIMETGVAEFNDLVIGTSIARPGPMNTVGVTYKNRKFGKEQIHYDHEIMEKYTRETLGCIVYQEQVMFAMTELAGMPMTEADKVRRIIAKKKDVKLMNVYKEVFINGASERISKKLAEKLWHDFEAHTGYSFNKSHAVAYSLLTYWTAWLKYNYPLEFMYALLKNEKDNDTRTEYLIESKRLNLKILLPHVNNSGLDFSLEGNAIRFGLTNIKYISENAGNKLVSYRPFSSYSELQSKVAEKNNGLNIRVLSALNAVGAASFDDNPRTGNERDNLYEYLNIPAFDSAKIPQKVLSQLRRLADYEDNGVFVIMGMVKAIKRGTGWSLIDFIDESGTTSIFHSENTPIEPGKIYAVLVADNRIARFATVLDVAEKQRNVFIEYLYRDKFPDVVSGMYKIISFQPRKTKAGKTMAILIISDENKNLSTLLVWPSIFPKAYGKCKEGAVVGIEFGQTADGTTYMKDVY